MIFATIYTFTVILRCFMNE